ncbi:MAG TPA: hypothetical protein VMB18_11985 [Terriglobales bacterium]|jgi:hypothetical protein|nr:hypothetical protein [Terriglobales bacterium]
MSNHRGRVLLCTAIYIVMACSVSLADDQAPPPVDVTGTWSVLAQSAFGRESLKTIQLTQTGNQIRGFFKGPNQSGPLAGFIEGNRIHFSTETRTVLNFRGKVDGNTITGTVGVHGKIGEWTATRMGVPNPN